MALDALVDSTQLDADLTSVANAIRTKGGTSAQLAFPAEFVQAIGNISGGILELLASGTYTVASQTNSFNISVSATGYAYLSIVVKKSDVSGSKYSSGWLRLLNAGALSNFPVMLAATCRRHETNNNDAYTYGNSSGGLAMFPDNASSITKLQVVQYNTSYPILAGDYDWYVYGVSE